VKPFRSLSKGDSGKREKGTGGKEKEENKSLFNQKPVLKTFPGEIAKETEKIRNRKEFTFTSGKRKVGRSKGRISAV